jgi:cyanophycin synthetase
MQGIDTVDQLAEVKSIVTRVTRPEGWAVLNGEDPRVWAMRRVTRAKPWAFALDPAAPALREALDSGGRAMTILDDDLTVLASGADPDPVVELVDVPMTLAGLSRFNIENALAAASAALAIGLSRADVVAGLKSFLPDAEHNPGRMNFFSLPAPDGPSVSVVMDLAHNEAGLEALLEIMSGVRRPGARLLLGLGAVGDRTDELIDALGEIGAKGSDVVAIGHKEWYLRGRTMDEIDALLRAGAARVGVTDIDTYTTEVGCLAALVERAEPGDVVGLMCHAERQEAYDWIAARGGTPDDPETLAAKVRAARV